MCLFFSPRRLQVHVERRLLVLVRVLVSSAAPQREAVAGSVLAAAVFSRAAHSLVRQETYRAQCCVRVEASLLLVLPVIVVIVSPEA